MGFLFFRGKKDKERAERREKRHALRKAEGAIDEVVERIKRMEKDATRNGNAPVKRQRKASRRPRSVP